MIITQLTYNFRKRKRGKNMKKKQLLALGMATVMALGVFAGCGDSKNASGGNASEKAEGGEEEKVSGEIRYAFWDSAQEAYFKKCVEEFNKIYPDVNVTLEPSTWDEYWTKLEAGATGGSIADVF